MTLRTKIISIQLFGLLLIAIVCYFDWPLETWFHYYMRIIINRLNPLWGMFYPVMIVRGEDGSFPDKWDMTCNWLWIYLGIMPMLYSFYKKVPNKKWIIVLGLLPFIIILGLLSLFGVIFLWQRINL